MAAKRQRIGPNNILNPINSAITINNLGSWILQGSPSENVIPQISKIIANNNSDPIPIDLRVLANAINEARGRGPVQNPEHRRNMYTVIFYAISKLVNLDYVMFTNIEDILGIEDFQWIENLKRVKVVHLVFNVNSRPPLPLPNFFSQLPLMAHFKVDKCQLTDINSILNNSLISLDIESANLPNLPEQLFNITTLKLIQLVDCDITEIPASINNLVELETLSLPGNNIQVLPNINNLVKLREIVLMENQLGGLPDLSILPNLEILDVGSNQLMTFQDISNFPSLRELNLEFNEISHFPPIRSTIQSPLNDINLSNNELTNFEVVGNINLRSLDLSHNALDFFPYIRVAPGYFNKLLLNNNSITRIPSLMLNIVGPDTDFDIMHNPIDITQLSQTILLVFEHHNIDINNIDPETDDDEDNGLGNGGPAPEAIAFEVHNVFDKINAELLIKFLLLKTQDNPNKFITMSDQNFKTYIVNKINSFISIVDQGAADDINSRSNLQNAFNTIYSQRIRLLNLNNNNGRRNKNIIGLSLDYTDIQPITFKQTYITIYINLCAYAYTDDPQAKSNININIPSTLSCAAGVVERFSLAFQHTISYISDKLHNDPSFNPPDKQQLLEKMLEYDQLNKYLVNIDDEIGNYRQLWLNENMEKNELTRADNPKTLDQKMEEFRNGLIENFGGISVLNLDQSIYTPDQVGNSILAKIDRAVNEMRAVVSEYPSDYNFGGKRKYKNRQTKKQIKSRNHRMRKTNKRTKKLRNKIKNQKNK
jgi:Leucine rich repeat